MSVYNGSITASGMAQSIPALGATASIAITNGGAPDPLVIAWNGNPASLTNGILISGSTIIDTGNNNPGLWPMFSAVSLSVWGPRAGQVFSIVYQ